MGREQRTVTGRRPKPVFKKINPIWWFGNDDEEQLPHGIDQVGRIGAGACIGTSSGTRSRIFVPTWLA
jgi:hypothetical protein